MLLTSKDIKRQRTPPGGAHSLAELQTLLNHFIESSKLFSLIINNRKIEIVY